MPAPVSSSYRHREDAVGDPVRRGGDVVGAGASELSWKAPALPVTDSVEATSEAVHLGVAAEAHCCRRGVNRTGDAGRSIAAQGPRALVLLLVGR